MNSRDRSVVIPGTNRLLGDAQSSPEGGPIVVVDGECFGLGHGVKETRRVYLTESSSLDGAAVMLGRMTLSDRVKRAMREHPSGEKKAADLARGTGLSKQAVSLILNGTTKQLASNNAQTLARYLRVSVDWLISGTGPMRPTTTVQNAVATVRDDCVEIPFLDVNGSMGTGVDAPDHVDTVRSITVSLPDLRKQCSFSAPSNLQIITGLGDSMKGTFSDGDPLLVDTGIKEARIDAVYVFELDGELYIKRLQRMPGRKLRVISDNRAAFDPYDLTVDQMERMNIRGRVVLAWNARRL